MKTIKNILPTLIILLFVIIVIFVTPRVVRIGKISCRSQFGECNQEINQSILKGQNQSLAKSKKHIEATLSQEAQVEDFSMQFKLPDKLEVYILEKKPRFGLKSVDNPDVALIDNYGYVLAWSQSTNLPTLIVEDNYINVGNKVETKTLFALTIMASVNSSYTIGGARIINDSLVIELPQGIEVIFPLEGDKEVLLGSFVLIVENLKKEDSEVGVYKSQIKTIDLRYKNPILR